MNTRRSGWADMAIGVQFNNVFSALPDLLIRPERREGIGKVNPPLFSKI